MQDKIIRNPQNKPDRGTQILHCIPYMWKSLKEKVRGGEEEMKLIEAENRKVFFRIWGMGEIRRHW